MKFKLSEIEIRVLRLLCQKEWIAGALAVRLKIKKSFLSRVLKELSEKGLVFIEKQGVRRIVRLSIAGHAQNFKMLSDSRPNSAIEGFLSGFALSVLVSAIGHARQIISYSQGSVAAVLAFEKEGTNTKLLLKEAGCSKATFYKVLRNLEGAGVIQKRSNSIIVSDNLVYSFAVSYADNIQLLIQRKLGGVENASVRVRKHAIVRTNSDRIPVFFSETGVSALASKGLEATLTSFNDYYFNLDEKKEELGMEDYFVHALLLAKLKQQDLPVLELFFAKNKGSFDIQRLKKLAEEYGVAQEFDETRRKVEFYEKMSGGEV
jgi:DNA-binding MarR family transcriptional regulator